MTEVRFYVNLPDRLGYACRLLRKAHSLGTPVVVTGEAADLQALDQALWTFSAQDFVPHAMVGSTPPEVMTRTPIVFAPDPLAAAPRGLLVNLGTSVPEGYDQFVRLFELIGTEPGAVQAARDRWRHYSQQGFSVQKHDPQAA